MYHVVYHSPLQAQLNEQLAGLQTLTAERRSMQARVVNQAASVPAGRGGSTVMARRERRHCLL